MKNKYILFGVYSILVLVLLGLFMPSDILALPKITAAEYLLTKPYIDVDLGFVEYVLIVPTSTFFVHLLGVIIVLLGVSFLKERNNETKKWWGISMIFWGVGAILAGISYQGLGYELKCVGVEYCMFTSWFELAYLYITAISIIALSIAMSTLVVDQKKKTLMIKIGVVSVLVYGLILVIGSIVSNSFMISYELFTILFMPHFILFFIINIKGYKKAKDNMNKSFIIMWILFLIVNVAYFVYLFAGLGEFLYDNYNIWFSANDVLHVLLILWFVYIWLKVKKEIQ